VTCIKGKLPLFQRDRCAHFLMSVTKEIAVAGDRIRQSTYNLVVSFFHFAITFYLESSISKTMHSYHPVHHVRHVAMNVPVDLIITIVVAAIVRIMHDLLARKRISETWLVEICETSVIDIGVVFKHAKRHLAYILEFLRAILYSCTL